MHVKAHSGWALMRLYIQLHHVCFTHEHIQPAKAASVFCISGHTMTATGPHPVGHTVLFMDSIERTGNTLEGDESSRLEAAAKLFCFSMDLSL